MDGEFVEVELGRVCERSFCIDVKANMQLINQVLVLHEKNPSQSVAVDRMVYLLAQ